VPGGEDAQSSAVCGLVLVLSLFGVEIGTVASAGAGEVGYGLPATRRASMVLVAETVLARSEHQRTEPSLTGASRAPMTGAGWIDR
jgi:hypothetical protein